MHKEPFAIRTILVTLIPTVIILAGIGFYFSSRQVAHAPTLPDPVPTPTQACTQDSDCTAPNTMCEAIQSMGVTSPNGGPTTTTIVKGVCKSKENAQCHINSDCVSGLLCHSNMCTAPIGNACSGPTDTSCGEGYACTEDCGPPIVRSNDPPVTSYSCQLKGYMRPCPICLAKHTRINTPTGEIPVEALQVGMSVWTLNRSGERVPAQILKTTQTPVPTTHQVVHIQLKDGRELFASPNHPIGDGRTIGSLSIGDILNGSLVTLAKRIPYQEQYTYDILPSGDTGLYWANDILLDSTLR